MFTGLIEDVGRIAAISPMPRGVGRRLSLEAPLLRQPMAPGDSLCVDGVCLTVVSWHAGQAEVEVGPETLSRTTLSGHGTGDPVNLERALLLSARLGGHLVSGHVDGVGQVQRMEARGEAWDLTLAVPAQLSRYIVEKGSIAVDGISLTVNQADAMGFSVSLIPHTQHKTTLLNKKVGQPVNLEVDIIGKYVEKLLGAYLPEAGLILTKLKEHGFA